MEALLPAWQFTNTEGVPIYFRVYLKTSSPFVFSAMLLAYCLNQHPIHSLQIGSVLAACVVNQGLGVGLLGSELRLCEIVSRGNGLG